MNMLNPAPSPSRPRSVCAEGTLESAVAELFELCQAAEKDGTHSLRLQKRLPANAHANTPSPALREDASTKRLPSERDGAPVKLAAVPREGKA